MLSNMRHGTESGYAKALDLKFPPQIVRRGFHQNVTRFGHRGFEVSDQLAAGDGAKFFKFSVPVAAVGLITQSGNNPLPDVSGQMQHEVSNTVGRPMGTPPDLVLGKSFEASNDPRQMLTMERMARLCWE